MAQAPKQEAAAEEEVKPAKSKKKLILTVVVLLLLAAAGGTAWSLTQSKAKPHEAEAVKEEAPKPPVFVTLETFTVNLVPESEPQFLQVDISLQVSDEKEAEHIKLHMPEVRNRLLILLTSKKASDISNIEGKKALTDEIVAQLKLPFSSSPKGQAVNSVFFTSFVIQ